MACKTEAVRDMVSKTLAHIQEPYDEDIILHVLKEIKRTHRTRYEELCGQLTKAVVNQWIGRWTSVCLGRAALKQVATNECDIVTSYSKLK